VTARLVLAVDGGGSKTDLALVHDDGALLSVVRGPKSSPHLVGLDGALEVLEQLLDDAVAEAGVTRNGQVAEIAEVLMAGVDFPFEEDALRDAVQRRGWAGSTSVVNDTFAVLRAGTEAGWGVAVVCGAGMNCIGVAPDGRHARFPALGAVTGDWGGGYDLGLAALSAAARSEDGRGPKTTLEERVPAHFGCGTPSELAQAIHRGEIPVGRLAELPRVIFAEADEDQLAAGIVERLAEEVVAFARVAVERLGLSDEPVEVLLGGGLLQSGGRRLEDSIAAGLRGVGPAITARRVSSPPIVGAALFGLDKLGAGPDAHGRVRRELGAAVAQIGAAHG
jgi:N-acetylglucosamine kinase-like BadF-type ATPase